MRSWATSSASWRAAGIRREGGLDLRRRAPAARRASTPSNSSREPAEGVVAVGPHLGDDGGHRLGRPVLLVGRARQRVPQGPAVAGEAPEVKATESHSPSMLPDRPASGPAPASDRSVVAATRRMLAVVCRPLRVP